MPNRLAQENSPYLLQHKDNPVDWYPWGDEALNKAKQENKPIFLSIGYAACHWCHVMERESFEDPQTAAMMNEHFINIKVDREERPDLDHIYMDAVVSLTGQGGWPMSVFLTPSGKPFYGGTYFPPARRYGMPSFMEVLSQISQVWQQKPEELEESGEKLLQHIQRRSSMPTPDDTAQLDPTVLDQAAQKIAESYDWKHGGWGRAPKFPQPMTILFLLRRASRGDHMALEIATHALDAMASGGMYDLIGGGFARYSVDDDWLVPHFEKMLYDNAQLARAYLHAYLLTGKPLYRQVCEETLDFNLREMTHPQGGFFSSIDADSEGEEGLFYTWTYEELRNLLDEEELLAMSQAYSISQQGNFEGRIVLQHQGTPAERPGLSPSLLSAHQKLFEARSSRVRPATDDKVLTAWNAWMNLAYSEVARYLNRPDYLEAARKNLQFLLNNMYQDSHLLRSWREGKALHQAYLEDYASLALACFSLYQSDPNPDWYQHAAELSSQTLERFYDQEAGFYDTASDHQELILRPQESQDNATPSGSSLAVQALLQLAAYTGNGNHYDLAASILGPLEQVFATYPTAFGNWLCALDFAHAEIKEVAILGTADDPAARRLIEMVWSSFRPDCILAASPVPVPEHAPPLLENRVLIEGRPTAYVCQHFSCQQPTTDAEELAQQLS
ncbi:MAG TPA: thioredoxin domain-containing protein [Anaerolineales bacterium]|jgi:uncharacterized protein YyaL (SSP411 family)|nr:thioredoxin domain-containing protein [Anaerolineales bacterium]